MTGNIPKKPASQLREEAKAKKKIESEMGKVEASLNLGNFSSVTTYEAFLLEAKRVIESFGLVYNPKNFKFIKENKVRGTDKRIK